MPIQRRRTIRPMGSAPVPCFSFWRLAPSALRAQLPEPPATFTIARLKFGGGGDWYNGPTEIPNLLAFIRSQTTIHTADREARVEIMDEDLFAYPVLYLTGHGNIRFSEDEVRRLRTYLEHGGFLFANDDYGLRQCVPPRNQTDVPG